MLTWWHRFSNLWKKFVDLTNVTLSMSKGAVNEVANEDCSEFEGPPLIVSRVAGW